VLDRRRAEFGANGFLHCDARIAVVAKHPYLDQAVHIKPGIDFFHDRRRQAGVSDQYDGFESVGLGAQFAALGGSEFQHKNPLKAVFYANGKEQIKQKLAARPH
jgi:hypothetical protein